MRKLPIKEKYIQKAILDYLEFRGFFHWRNNSGATKTEKGGFIRFGAVGSPDIFVIREGVCYGIEVKNEKGKQSEGQVAFEKNFTRAGGVYFVARSLDEFMSFMR